MGAILIAVTLMVGMFSNFAQADSLQATAIPVPGGEGGIGFDDLNFSPYLHKVIVPAGHTGKLVLIDPESNTMVSLEGFTSSSTYQKGHDTGITSADAGEGFIFVLDHGAKQIDAVDAKGKIAATASVAGNTDYVRYSSVNHEIWVTEPEDQQIEVFSFTPGKAPSISATELIPLSQPPESLTMDHVRQHMYTNLGNETVAVDLHTHRIINKWPNGCGKSRGNAIDELRGLLFVSCGEGRAEVYDLSQTGAAISSVSIPAGVDVISYNPILSHLYVTGSQEGSVSVVGVSANGQLSVLGSGQAAEHSHCVVGDDQNNIWVCDPKHGQLLKYKDIFPASR